ncbi:uncharacterized protein UTRI_01020_B [Ustilago trichophora]|uniref:Uncharacterized protein n=1 Tax=Ustilago trichophora TaxID=86804 RepID=A0A5C3DSX2_9BASI|nr:uncharacterized protein UTRI_01020_B [Ustilago trichophora]
MDSSRLPPQTPRRQLLKRIHRRSSILPSMDPSSHLAPSSSTSTTRSSSRRTSLNPDAASPSLGNAALEKHDEAEEDYEPTQNNQDETHSQRAHSNSYRQAADDNTPEAGYLNEDENIGDENGEEAAWAQVDELMDTVQLKNQRILELEKSVSQLQRDLQAEKERTKPSKGNNTSSSSEKGLTRAAAVKLEREFLSQEMILKGLQRDNEDKTLEVESLRRKVKIMSDFLARQYGPDDWEAVVSASSGAVTMSSTAKESSVAVAASPEKESLSAVARVLGAAHAGSPRATNRAKFTPVLGSDANMNPFSPVAASPTKALNNDDVLIPTIARLQTPASSPSKLFVSSFAPRRTSMDNADTSIDADEDDSAQDEKREPSSLVMPEGLESKTSIKGALPAGMDPNVLLASIESVRLLIQGFERKNAMRRAELESTIEKAIEAERRAERLQASASAVTPSMETLSIAAT